MSRLGLLACSLVVCLLCPSPAAAWKPNTHVYFAERAMEDALDGTVTLRKMNHFSTPTGNEPELGNFLADPAIVDALNRFPRAFRAGVLGPDAYPDLMTGQSVIHAEDADHGAGSDAWLVFIYDSARATNDPEVLAFAVGFLAHAAGDQYGHTMVNAYAGGPFALGANALTHIDVEGYIGKKTPPPLDWNADIGPNVKAFIYRTMVDATAGTHARTLYDRKSGVGLVTLPYIFSVLRDSLLAFVQNYRSDLAFFAERASNTSFPVNGIWAAAYVGHLTVVGPLALYAEAWISDIDAGLRALPDVSMRVASTLLFSPSPNYLGAKNILDDYWRHHVKSMLGVPDIIVAVSNFAEDVVAAVLPWNPIDVLKEAILEYLIQQATQASPTEWMQHFTSPELTLEPAGRTERRDELNGLMALDGGTQLAWQRFPAGSNTVTMIKLLLLGDSGLRQLFTTLGHPPDVANTLITRSHQNAMIGYMKSLDFSKQWAINDDVMMFHADCAAYQELFVSQKGDGLDPSLGGYQVVRDDLSVKAVCQPVASLTLSPNRNASTVPFYCEPSATAEVVLAGPVGPFGGRVKLTGDAVVSSPPSVWVPANQSRYTFSTSIAPVRQATTGSLRASRQNVEKTASLSVGPSRVTELRLREDFWENGWQSRYIMNGEAVRSATRFSAEIGMDCNHAVRTEPVVVELCPKPIQGSFVGLCVVLGRAAAAPSLTLNLSLVPKTVDGWYRIRARYLQSYVEVEVFVIGSRLARVAVEPNYVALSPSSTTSLADAGVVELVYPAGAAGEVVELAYARGLSGPSTVTVAAGQKTARFSLTAPQSPTLACAGDIGVVIGVSRVERTSIPAFSLPARSSTPLNPRAQFGYLMMDYADTRSPSECFDVGILDDADVMLATLIDALHLSYSRNDPRPVDRQLTQYLP